MFWGQLNPLQSLIPTHNTKKSLICQSKIKVTPPPNNYLKWQNQVLWSGCRSQSITLQNLTITWQDIRKAENSEDQKLSGKSCLLFASWEQDSRCDDLQCEKVILGLRSFCTVKRKRDPHVHAEQPNIITKSIFFSREKNLTLSHRICNKK